MSDLLLVLGVLALGAALRSFRNPLLFRIGTWMVIFASFLAGWLFTGSLAIGVLMGLGWFFLPWVEILVRLRKLRLPMERHFTERRPPTRDIFPTLPEITAEIEREGFDHVTDAGWEDANMRQFYRIFHNSTATIQASICLAEQGDLAFYYLTVTSRTPGGRIFLTWNYPFAYGLKFSPLVRLNREPSGTPFREMLRSHTKFLREDGIADGAMTPMPEEKVLEVLQHDFRSHLRHNLDTGLLAKSGENSIRYTFRGMCFLWLQFLRDVVRIF